MPAAEITRPPHQHSADTKPALRGPARSSQPPKMAADEPRNTKNSVYMTLRSDTRQSQLVVTSACMTEKSAGQATGWVMPSTRVSGSQNTEKPYAMPMHRWMASAAGGTIQRLKPGRATVRLRSSSLPVGAVPTVAVDPSIYYVSPINAYAMWDLIFHRFTFFTM